MAPRVRLAAFALLTAGAIVAVRLRAGIPPPGASPEPFPAVPAGDLGAAITWLMAATVPFLALLFILSFGSRRRHNSASADRRWTRATTRGLVVAVGVITAMVLVLAVVARFGGRPEKGTTSSIPPAEQDTVSRPTVPSEPIPPRGDEGTTIDFDQISVFVVVALLVLFLSAMIAGRRPRAAHEERSHAHGGSPRHSLIVAAQHALSAVDEPAQDARTAIIRCYAALEEALSGTPGAVPQPSDTPSEVIRRAVEAGTVDDKHGQRLLCLFAEARFSGHPMSEHDRAAAAETLRLTLADLEGVAWTRS